MALFLQGDMHSPAALTVSHPSLPFICLFPDDFHSYLLLKRHAHGHLLSGGYVTWPESHSKKLDWVFLRSHLQPFNSTVLLPSWPFLISLSNCHQHGSNDKFVLWPQTLNTGLCTWDGDRTDQALVWMATIEVTSRWRETNLSPECTAWSIVFSPKSKAVTRTALKKPSS